MNKLKVFFFSIVCQFFVFSIKAQVVIADRYFNIDMDKQLILINQEVGELNTSFPEVKTTISSEGMNYTFENPLLTFEKGIAYIVRDEQDNLYQLYFTELPIINILTDNLIVNEPRVHAQLSLCESNGNLMEDHIGIEYRGGSTQSLPKKSFRIEFWEDAQGVEKKDVALLGMRNDDDWNLEALSQEPLRLRSKRCFDLWRSMDEIYYQNEEPEAVNGVHLEFVELFVNGAYRGVYGLSERVDRKQLKLKKKTDTEIRGVLYKGVGWGASTFTSLPNFNNNNAFWGGFQNKYPTDTIEWSNLYDLVDFFINENDDLFYENYQDAFNLDNAVNYFIFLNLLRAQDNTGKNIFIARYDIGEPYFYVPWDLNATLGLFWNGDEDDFVHEIFFNGLYQRLRNDVSPGGFLERLEERWATLRNNIITTQNIVEPYFQQFNYLNSNGVYERESLTWPDFEFQGENSIAYLEQWVTRRIEYLDGFFYNTNSLTSIDDLASDAFSLKIFPNPTFDQVEWRISPGNPLVERVIILNAKGKFIQKIELLFGQNVLDLVELNPGLYFLSFEFSDGKKILKRSVLK